VKRSAFYISGAGAAGQVMIKLGRSAAVSVCGRVASVSEVIMRLCSKVVAERVEATANDNGMGSMRTCAHHAERVQIAG
jgi:hypothetical protein